ncbi:MAG: GIY-YIG nuclease family protein [Bacteroidetes bacterium]|nr:GIY-YIG nuclease family protein [Bacteroidota bacterium]
MAYYIYILSSRKNGTLYIGVTGNLSKRIVEHKESLIPGFTQRYHVTQLIYFEEYTYIQDAIVREKQLKKWNRAWKIRLIEKSNPEWKDLFNAL